MPAQVASLVGAGILGGGNGNAAQAYFDQQSPEDQAAIRASWNTPGQDSVAVGAGFAARPGSRLADRVMMNNWYNNANAAGAIPPPPPVAPPPGPAQTAPVAGPVQPTQPAQPPPTASVRPVPAGGSTLPQPGQPSGSHSGYNPGGGGNPNHTPTGTGTLQPQPPPAPWAGNAVAGASPITTMMTNNTFAKPTKQPFDYEAAKQQYGAAEAKRMESESR